MKIIDNISIDATQPARLVGQIAIRFRASRSQTLDYHIQLLEELRATSGNRSSFFKQDFYSDNTHQDPSRVIEPRI